MDNTSSHSGTNSKIPRSPVRVIGVGDTGCRAVAAMADSLRGLAEVTGVDTDFAALQQVNNAPRLLIGENRLHGFGAGGDSHEGAIAAQEAAGQVTELVARAGCVVIVAGLGGGTGSGAAPVIASISRDAGAHTIAIVNLPFEFEGAGRAELAADALDGLRARSDAVIPLSNDRLLNAVPADSTMEDAFARGRDLTAVIVRRITSLFASTLEPRQTTPGHLRSVLSSGSLAFAGSGEAAGPAAPSLAAEMALAAPCAGVADLALADRVIVMIEAGPDLSASRVATAMETVRSHAGPGAVLHMGVNRVRGMAGSVRVTVLAGCREARRPVAVSRPRSPQPLERVLLPLFG